MIKKNAGVLSLAMEAGDGLDATWIREDEAIVRRKVYEKTGHLIREAWFSAEGKPHSFEGGAAVREFDPQSGRLILERWMDDGIEHRWAPDEPSEIAWDPHFGTIVQKSFRRFGLLHRDHHRPARVWFEKTTGARYREEFWVDGRLHREGFLPAIVVYDVNNGEKILSQEFYTHGQRMDASTQRPRI